MKRRFLFIINPITGRYGVDRLRHACSVLLSKDDFNWEIISTTHAGHAEELAFTKSQDFEAIIAVGGDGTVNEVANGLLNSSTPMGIIPNGSGNGLARHLTYSMILEKAITQITEAQANKIDILKVNGRSSFNISGIGFDAHVASLFQKSKKRGLISYILISAKEFLKYNHPKLVIKTDAQTIISEKTFSLTLANASQLGNNAVVARYADLTDGQMDLCLIRAYPWWYLPIATFKLFTQKLHRSRFFTGGRFRKVVVEIPGKEKVIVQVDGEPLLMSNPVEFKIVPQALNVLVPN